MYDVTVAVCCYRQKKWLHRCLRSLASQTLDKSKFEVIVVNDQPGTELESICENLKDFLNIRLINNSSNIGLPACLNKILNVALGRYFVRVDCDDYVSKHYLNYLSIFLNQNRSYQSVSCDYSKVNSVGKIIERHVSQNNEIIACGHMFTYESLCEIGFYDEKFKMREGHDLMNRFSKRFSSFNIPIPLYRYRIHDKNRTKDETACKEYDKLLSEEK